MVAQARAFSLWRPESSKLKKARRTLREILALLPQTEPGRRAARQVRVALGDAEDPDYG